jgi:hypothetical protein
MTVHLSRHGARVVPPEMHIFDCAVRLIAQLNKVENRARDNFRDLWDCGAGIKNAEVVAFCREPSRQRQRSAFWSSWSSDPSHYRGNYRSIANSFH